MVLNNDSFIYFFFRLTKKKLAKCILATFLDYQDLTRDAFLLAKIIASAGGWNFLSSSENVFVLLVSYCILSLSAHLIIIINWKGIIVKGQLISKGNFGVFNSSKTILKILIFALAYLGRNFSFLFGRIRKSFRN